MGEREPIDSAQPHPDQNPAGQQGIRHLATRLQHGEQASFRSVLDALGGVRGVIETTLPAAVFIIVQTIGRDLWLSVGITLGVLLALTGLRLLSRTQLGPVASGAIGALIGLVFALISGRSDGAFVPGLVINACYAIVLAGSAVLRRPLSGYVVGAFTGNLTEWTASRRLLRAHTWATLVFAAVSAIRVAVIFPLWLVARETDEIAAVGTAKLLVGLPLSGLALFACYVILAPASIDVAEERGDAGDVTGDGAPPR